MVVARVEASPNNRAGCQNKECKDAGVKITKGEFRYAIQVTIKDHQSWQYRHWGCVTPKQIENLIETTEGDTDLVDGYDEVPAEFQEKIQFALSNGHVPDEDWKGDIEVNRPGQSGFRVKVTKKKAKKDDDGDDAEEKPKKKRARKVKDADEEEEDAPAPKKARGKKITPKADDSEDEAPPPKKARGRPLKKQADASDDEENAPAPKKVRAKKAAAKDDNEEKEAEASKPPLKKAKGKKTTPKEEAVDEDDEVQEDEISKPKRGKKAVVDAEVKAPQKRGRKKKVADE